MSRDAGERAQPPSPRRLKAARQRGEVALSLDLGAAAALATAFAVLCALGPAAVARLIAYFGAALARAPAGGGGVFADAARAGLDVAVSLLALPLGLVFLTVLLVGFAQTRGLVTLQPVRFDVGRLSPAAALRKVFDPRLPFELGRALAGAAALGAVAWLTLRPLLAQLPGLARLPARRALDAFGVIGQRLGLRIVLVTLALAVLDAIVVRARHRRALLTTRAEARRERAEQEGDDVHRARRRRAHRELGEEDQAARADVDIRRAAVIVTAGAPATLAVALVYQPGGASAPVVLRRGRHRAAARIEEVARAAGVPVVSRAALADGLALLAEGNEIPEARFEEVATILKAVYARQAVAPS